MSLYLDTSVLLALLTADPLAQRADRMLRREMPVLVVSDWAAAEFASAVARRVRMGQLGVEHARALFPTFDGWVSGCANRVELAPTGLAVASALLRRLDLALRKPDAVHVAMAQRVDAKLATFDAKLADAARRTGLAVLTE